MPNGISSLSSGFSKRAGDARQGTVFGIVVHTTGSGVVDASAKKGRDPLEYTVHDVYENPDNYCAHYVVGWDGTIWQVTPEFDELDRAAAAHGMSPRALLEEATAIAAAAGLVTGAPVPDGLRANRQVQ